MTSIEILLDAHFKHQPRPSDLLVFLLKKAHVIVQRVVRKGSIVDTATPCVDHHSRDDSLNDALIILVN